MSFIKQTSSKNFNKFSIKKQDNLNTSKTSTTGSHVGPINNANFLNNNLKKISIANKSIIDNKSDGSNKIDILSLNCLKTEILSNDEISRRFKNELDVSNIITLEQEVNDDLIINQKDDKLLISSLDDEDENISNNNNLMMNNHKFSDLDMDIEEILDDKWTIFSR